MNSTLFLFIILTSASALVNEDWWEVQSSEIFKKFLKQYKEKKPEASLDSLKELSRFKTNMLKSFMETEDFADVVFEYLMGEGSYGAVFRGKRKSTGELLSLKVMWEKNDRYRNCIDAYDAYDKLKTAGVQYLIDTKFPMKATDVENGMYLCGIVMEHALPTTSPMFEAGGDDKERWENNNQFLAFSRRALLSFSQINHAALSYHADVKPDNLMWKLTDRGIEPRVIDYDLVFRKLSPHFNPENIIFTVDYRPPELKRIVPKTNPNEQQEKELAKYKYDADFREEAWAVGKTLLFILKLNKTRLNLADPRIDTLEAIFNDMNKENLKDRICTEEAWERAMDIPPITNPPHKQVPTKGHVTHHIGQKVKGFI